MKKCWEMGTLCLCTWEIDCLKPVLHPKFSIMWDYKYFFVGGGHGKNLWLTCKLDLGSQGLLTPLLPSQCSICPPFPPPEPFWRQQPWGSKVLWRPSGWYTLLNSGKAFSKLLRFLRAVQRSTCLADAQDKPHMLSSLAHGNCHLPI